MMKFICLLFLTLNVFAQDLTNLHFNEYLDFEQLELNLSKKPSIKFENFNIKTEKFLKDYKNRISDDFNVPNFFLPNVRFWFLVYSHLSSKQVIIHDKSDLSNIYFSIDYSDIYTNNDQFISAEYQVRHATNMVLKVKELFNNMIKGLDVKDTDFQNNILKSLSYSNINIDKKPNEKQKQILKTLVGDVRIQTGHKDNINSAIHRAETYMDTMLTYANAFNLPKELLAIPFLESSFRLDARSKVGASGIWQFMGRIARHFMTINRYQDSRQNPFIATVSAMHLLKQNKMILKRWDLAITAYNSGTKHLINARRKLKMKKPSLEQVFQSVSNPNVGFASKNFYAGFLAILHSIVYSDELFGIDHELFVVNRKNIMYTYVAKCRLRPSKMLTKKSLKDLNYHLNYHKRRGPKGLALYSYKPLPSKYFYRVPIKQLVRYYPKKLSKLVRRRSCK